MYFHRSKEGRDNFYIKKDSNIVLLPHKKYLYKDPENQKIYLREVNIYITDLKHYLSDCKFVWQRRNKIEYNKESLQNLFKGYYECIFKQPEFEKKKEKTWFDYGLVGGVTSTTLKFTGNSIFYRDLSSFDFSYSLNPTLGFFLKIIPPRSFRRWSLYNELAFKRYKVSNNPGGTITLIASLPGFGINTIAQDQIYIGNIMRYKFFRRQSIFYFGYGFSQNLTIGKINTNTTINRNTQVTTVIEAVPSIKNYQIGFICELGVKFKHFGLNFRYERQERISNIIELPSRTLIYSFLLMYQINKFKK